VALTATAASPPLTHERALVRWHDLECGGYTADLPLWHELAGEPPHAVLELGAGTGRIALALALAGHHVTAVEWVSALCDAMRRRAHGLPLRAVCADARELRLRERYELVIVAMQTVQLMGGAEGRRRLFEAVREQIAPGGRAAFAFIARLETFDGAAAALVTPDVVDEGELRLVSRALAIRRVGGGYALERQREQYWRGELRHSAREVVHLDGLSRAALEREARAAGLQPLGERQVLPTAAHAGSSVVIVGG
jgi:SAM-dependent methyltransferase